MFKRLLITIIIISSALVLMSCKSSKKVKEPEKEYIAQGQTKSGGMNAESANIKEIKLSTAGESPTAVISFVLGSKISGVDEAELDHVPSYKAYYLESPARMVVEFTSLDFWDYTRTLKIKDDPFVYNVFRQSFSHSKRVKLVFQLKKNATCNLSEQGSQLILSFKLQDSADIQGFFVTSNALSEYSNGTIPENSGLTPTLCDDLSNIALISAPFETEEEALAFATEFNGRVPAITIASLPIVKLGTNKLPAFDSQQDYSQVISVTAMRKDDVEQQLPVLMPDGIYLSTSPDGLMLFSKRVSLGDITDVESMETQELWVLEQGGKPKRLSEIEFETIERAEFSPDGKRLAILEIASDESNLHIYDMETNELSYTLGYEGLGKNTYDFVWDDIGTSVFAISGNDSLTLQRYDFTIPDETARVSAVEDQPAGEGDLDYHNAELYFCATTNEGAAIIYRIKPEGGMRQEFARGNSFRLSDDGKSMAIIDVESSSDGEGEDTTQTLNLKVRDMGDGNETYIVKNRHIVSFEYDRDGILYFIESSENQDDKYPYKLYSFDAANKEPQYLCDLISQVFYTSQSAGKLYIPYISNDYSNEIRATFILNVK